MRPAGGCASFWDMADPAFDFDELAALAARDPEGFERRRQALIEAALAEVPEADRRERLRRLQWRIDQVRRTAGTPMAACLRISKMMWESLVGEGGLLEALERLGRADPQAPPRRQAEVLRFPAERLAGRRDRR